MYPENKEQAETKILHVDGDNFFVACELVRFPELKGKPVVVGEERGIASALSYEAKALGITRGMPIFEIRNKYKNVHVLPSHFELYEQYSERVYNILSTYSDTVERYSIDECFALLYTKDIYAGRKFTEHTDLAERIKNDIERSLGITVSIGIADTKTVAKIGSKYNKPSGCTHIHERNITHFLKQTPIGKVWGIGRSITNTLMSYNVLTAYDFINLDQSFVKKHFGEQGLCTWYELQGKRMLNVANTTKTPKSLQSTRSFGKSIKATYKERSFFYSELSRHAELLCTRLRQHNLKTCYFSFFLKKNTPSYSYISYDIELGFYTDNPSDLCKQIEQKLYAEEDSTKDVHILTDSTHIKATGITVYKLRPTERLQDDLFALQSTIDTRNSYIKIIDSVCNRLGADSIHLCSSLTSRQFRHKEHTLRNVKNKFIYGLPLPYMGEVS